MTFFNKFVKGSNQSRVDQGIQSIVENLNNLLNTKKGYGSFLKDFGIRDMNQYSSKEHLASAIMDEVTSNIEQYEPRLKLLSISVEDNDDPFRISFKLQCKVRGTSESLFMEFDSVYNDFHIKHS